MSAYRDVFLSESAEYLQSITDGLLALEANPDDLGPVEAIFRGAHSLKGMAAAMSYDRTQETAHRMESLMDTVRRKTQRADASLIDVMLQATDALRDLIAAESEGTAPPDIASLLEALSARATQPGVAEYMPPADGAAADADGGALYRVCVTLEDGCVLKGVRAYMVIKRLSHMGTVVETKPGARELEDEQFGLTFEVMFRTKVLADGVRQAIMGVTEVAGVEVDVVEGSAEPATAARPSAPRISDTQTVRISIAHLDSMVDLVGELVILRSRLERIAGEFDRPDLAEALDALEKVSTELQHEVMRTRMVPVGNIFNRFPRMVRDLAHSLGKDVALDTSGLEIELDRTVLDEIGDPIVHLLRNAVDHGIEPPAERRAAGKPARGTVTLTAEREREQVRITVTDDGRGLDRDRIWAKAVERGIIDPALKDSLSDHDVYMLACTPGFTTAETATRISGRGVGMDVVKGKIEYLGGSISIRSTHGQGTSVSLVLPLTLAIIQALLVGCSDRIYALPLSAVDEVLSLHEVDIKRVEGRPTMVLRDGEVVSVYRLESACGHGSFDGPIASRGDHIVLVRTAESVHALAVPQLLGRREIVIKPLSRLFRGIRGFGGATVLGDGRVALILDPRTLFEREG